MLTPVMLRVNYQSVFNIFTKDILTNLLCFCRFLLWCLLTGLISSIQRTTRYEVFPFVEGKYISGRVSSIMNQLTPDEQMVTSAWPFGTHVKQPLVATYNS